MEISWTEIIAFIIGSASLMTLGKMLTTQRKKSIWFKWEEQSKKNNKVILHALYGQSKKLPTPSPFVLKVETYLRMAKIPYEIDTTDIWGPKGKSPWISVNGTNVSDSEMIVQYLGKKFTKRFDTMYSDEQRSIGTAVRIMLEEYVYWGGLLWRFAFGGRDTFQQVRIGEIEFKDFMIFHMIAPSLKSLAWSQGLGRHSEEEVLAMMEECLRSVSNLLGKKLFLLGSQPCEVDCAAFGQLASAVYMDNSPFQKLLEGDLRNLREYCNQIKDEFWPDWDDLVKGK